MRKITLPKESRIYVPFLGVALILALVFPKAPKFEYDYRKGAPWKYETLFSQFDFPLYKTPEQMAQELSKASPQQIAYYKFSDETTSRSLKAVDDLPLEDFAYLKPQIRSALSAIYQRGIISDEGVKPDRRISNLSSELIYIQKNKRAAKYPLDEILRQSDARKKLLSDLSASNASVNLDSVFRSFGVYDLIVPNLVYDSQTTELVGAEAAVSVSPTQGFVSAGELIVSEGEIVTAEIAQMLDSYKTEYEINMGSEKPLFLVLLGNLAISLILAVILFFTIFFCNREVLFHRNELLYVLFVFLLGAVPCCFSLRMSSFLLALPLSLPALYLQAFFKKKSVIAIYFVSILPLIFFAYHGAALYVMFLFCSMLCVCVIRKLNRGWEQFIIALVAFFSLFVSYYAFRLTGAIEGRLLIDILHILIGSIITVAAYPLVYLFEKMFSLLSPTHLDDLADPANVLLRELELKAPGTFQHSLQVMSMADAAVRAVNGDVHLVRAAALYHDIGKINNPLCFVENQASLSSGEEDGGYHSALAPQQSAQDIIKHVSDGLEIARRFHLPSKISEFILSHHGTTCASYFYNKYLNDGGDPAEKPLFTYPGVCPSTKEQVILMICDSVEAASRTLTDNSAKTYSDFVESIVASKISEGQFERSDITMRELTTVKETLKSYLAQMYHERVAYPERKSNNEIINNNI